MTTSVFAIDGGWDGQGATYHYVWYVFVGKCSIPRYIYIVKYIYVVKPGISRHGATITLGRKNIF